jgi:hypothetical protein
MDPPIKKIVVGILGLIGLGWAGFSFFIAAAAFSAALTQCPHGSDCHDATLAAVVGGALGLAGLIVAMAVALYFRKLTKIRNAIE